MKKLIFFFVWILLITLVPITILQTTSFAVAAIGPAYLVNFAQRMVGLTAFTLMFTQIILGSFMTMWLEKVGGWVYKFHIINGAVTYTLVLLHGILLMIFNHYIGIGWNPYLVFINVCLLCNKPIDYYYTLGRVSFWLLTIAVLAADLRKINPWMQANWRKFHVLNYITFLLVGAHGFLLGTDFKIQPFYSFAVIAYAVVIGIVVFIEIPRLYKNFMNWIKG